MIRKILARIFGRLQAEDSGAGVRAELPRPFQRVQQISEVHDYFFNFNLATDPFLQAEGSLPGYCYVCDEPVLFEVDRPSDGSAVNWRETLKCPKCRMINRWRGCLHLFEDICRPSQDSRVYITEVLSPVFDSLKSRLSHLTSSEFLSGSKPGELVRVHGRPIRNEDVTKLSFNSESFDTILSFDVLEHVPDYRAALEEFHRVLDHNGYLILTVPFSFQQETNVRATINGAGEVEHLMEPCYHGDPLSSEGVLAYYDFGMELLDELKEVGFGESYLVCYSSNAWGYPGGNVAFVAQKLK